MRKLLSVMLSAAMLSTSFARGEDLTEVGTSSIVKKSPKCLFPKSKKRAPAWVCEAHAEGMAVAAMGSATKSKAGESFMEEMAVADARTHLVQSLSKTRQHKNSASSGEATSQLTDASLENSKVIKHVYGPDGTLYVLIGIARL